MHLHCFYKNKKQAYDELWDMIFPEDTNVRKKLYPLDTTHWSSPELCQYYSCLLLKSFLSNALIPMGDFVSAAIMPPVAAR